MVVAAPVEMRHERCTLDTGRCAHTHGLAQCGCDMHVILGSEGSLCLLAYVLLSSCLPPAFLLSPFSTHCLPAFLLPTCLPAAFLPSSCLPSYLLPTCLPPAYFLSPFLPTPYVSLACLCLSLSLSLSLSHAVCTLCEGNDDMVMSVRR